MSTNTHLLLDNSHTIHGTANGTTPFCELHLGWSMEITEDQANRLCRDNKGQLCKECEHKVKSIMQRIADLVEPFKQ